jgi:hypothetical protein
MKKSNKGNKPKCQICGSTKELIFKPVGNTFYYTCETCEISVDKDFGKKK